MEALEVMGKVKEMIVKRLNLPLDPTSIKDDAVLFGAEDGALGLDSVDSLELAVGLSNEFNVQVTEDDMGIFQSVQTHRRLRARLGQLKRWSLRRCGIRTSS